MIKDAAIGRLIRQFAFVAIGVSLSIGEVRAAFQSAPIILVFPPGARTLGMGEVGTALADDETAPYWNPAGLGVPNSRWERGAATHFWEQLLPALHFNDLWHYYTAFVWQFPRWGGIAGNVNYLNYGENSLYDEEGRPTEKFQSWDAAVGLSWGFNFEEIGLKNHYFGLTAKYVYSALIPTNDQTRGVGQTFAFDAGYLWRFAEGMRLGVALVNMGPAIYYTDPRYKDPLPFNIALALGLKKRLRAGRLIIADLNAEVRAVREFAKNYPNGSPDPFWKAIHTDWADTTFTANVEEIQLNWGEELVLFNTGILRSGFLWDWLGQRYEKRLGFGVRLFNHFQLDYYWIISPEGFMAPLIKAFVNDPNDPHRNGSYGVRNGQWGVTLTLTKLGIWPEKDRTWWLAK